MSKKCDYRKRNYWNYYLETDRSACNTVLKTSDILSYII